MKLCKTIRDWFCEKHQDKKYYEDPNITAQGIIDVWKYTDPDFIDKIKKIVNSIDEDKIKMILNLIEEGDDGYLNIKINLKVKKEND